MAKIARTTLLGLAAFLGWLGLSYLALIFAASTRAPLTESWVSTFPMVAVLPAILLSGGVASYFAGEHWLLSAAVMGLFAVGLLWLFVAFSGVWWSMISVVLLGVALAVVGGYAAQLIRRHVRH